MATSWALGTDGTRMANTGDTQDNLINVARMPEGATRRITTQRRLASGALVEDYTGKYRAWTVTQRRLTATQKNAVIALLSVAPGTTLYFRDAEGAIDQVRPVGDVDVAPRFGNVYDLTWSVETVSLV